MVWRSPQSTSYVRLLGRLDVNWSYAHLLRGCNAPPPHNLRTRATSMFWLQGISCYATQSALTEYLVYIYFFSSSRIYFPVSGQAVVTGVVPSPPRFLPSTFIAHRVQQSHCSSIFHRVLLTHALALSASQFVHKKKSPRFYSSMHSGGFKLTKPTYRYTRLKDNLIRHRGNRLWYTAYQAWYQ